jgi:hypothetical protein
MVTMGQSIVGKVSATQPASQHQILQQSAVERISALLLPTSKFQ